MGIKVNLGSGLRKYDGFVNLDGDPNVNPDYVVDFEKDRLPFEDNTVEYVFAMHILEHIGDGFFHLMQEIYRVCHHSAILRVVGPHHRHDDFFMDPTHKRPINHSIMQHFDKAWCDNSIENVGSSSGMANVYKVDIRMPEYEYTPDPYYQPMFDDMKMKFEKKEINNQEYEKFIRWSHGTNNFYQFFKTNAVIIKDY